MKNKKRIIALALAVMLLGGVFASADGAPEDKIPSDGITAADEAELAEVVKKASDEANVSSADIGVAICFTRSGECCYYNADEWMYGASLYKLPMIMKFSNMGKNGELEGLGEGFRQNIEKIKEGCLVYSDNSWALALSKYVFPDSAQLRQINADIAGWTEDMLPQDFYKTMCYSPRFMLDILKELYVNADEYPGVIDYMRQASPERYFRREMEGRYVIAQKYGSADDVTHAAGIIYTEYPVLLVVMTSGTGVSNGGKLVGIVSKAVMDYCEAVDERYEIAYNERELAERERLEQERLAEEERLAQEAELTAKDAVTAPHAESETTPDVKKGSIVLTILGAAVAGGCVVFFRGPRRRKW